MNNAEFSPSRRAWNRFFTAAVWVAAALVIVLVAGIIVMVLARGIPHISVEFLTTTASVLKGTDGILPAILNTLYVIVLTLLIVLPLGVGAAVYLTEYALSLIHICVWPAGYAGAGARRGQNLWQGLRCLSAVGHRGAVHHDPAQHLSLIHIWWPRKRCDLPADLRDSE